MSQSLSKVYLHIVFSTKKRMIAIQDNLRKDLEAYLARTLIELGSTAEIVKAVEDHVHILCVLSRTISISKLLEEIKSFSSKWMKTQGASYRNFAWQDGYSVFSVSESIVNKTKTYILNQDEHHKRVSYKDELLNFLKKYKIPYDEKYLWD